MAENTPNNSNNLQWWVLLTVIIGTFLGRLDQTIVSLALPKIITDFNINVTSAGWIATAYILANAVFVPIWGKLGDTIGRKKVYIMGFSIFIFGSVLAGLAWNLSSMILFRIIQSIASSADYPTAMAIIAVTFKQGKERARALGIWSASFAAAAAFGPLIGGPLIDNFGWRSIFLINLPIGLIGILMALAFVSESTSEKKDATFDWWGALTLGGSLTSLVLILDKGMDWGWLSVNALICYAAVLIFGAIFIKIEHNNPEPIVDLAFFKNSIFVNALANNFIVFMGMIGCVFLIPIFSQTFLGYNATQSGMLFIPMAAAMIIAAQIGSNFIGKIQARYIISLSTFMAGVGIFLFHYLDPRTTALGIIVPLSIMAFGLGFGMSQRTVVITYAVPQDEIGVASSILALARNIAGAFGIAIFSTVLDNSINSNVLRLSQSSIFRGSTPLEYQQFISLIILKADISAYGTVFLISSTIVFIGAIAMLFMKIEKEKEKVDAPMPIIIEG